MRLSLFPVAFLSATVSSQLLVPFLRSDPEQSPLSSSPSFGHAQAPLMDPAGPGPAVPPSAPGPAEPPSGSRGDVMLSDVMGQDRSITLFARCVHTVACWPSPPPSPRGCPGRY